MSIHIRWMIPRDMKEVLAIENAAFEFPWAEEDFVQCLRQRNCIGMVAEVEDRVAGYMVYLLHQNCIHLLSFAAHPPRNGVGTALIEKLKGKLIKQRRSALTLEVRETNLPAQRFFASVGFRALSVIRGYFDNGEDAYLMRFDKYPPKPQTTQERLNWKKVNA